MNRGKEACFFLSSTFPPLLQDNLNLRFLLCQQEERYVPLQEQSKQWLTNSVQGFKIISLFWKASEDYAKFYAEGWKRDSVQLDSHSLPDTHL